MYCRWPRFESSEVVIDGANYHEFMVSTNTLTAKDTLTQVPDDKRVCFLHAGIVRHWIEPYLADTQIGSNLPQLASVSLAANNAGLGVIGHHEPDNISTVVSYGGGVCPYN